MIYIQYVPNNVLPLLTRIVFSGDVTVYRESIFVLGIPTSYSRDIQRNSRREVKMGFSHVRRRRKWSDRYSGDDQNSSSKEDDILSHINLVVV